MARNVRRMRGDGDSRMMRRRRKLPVIQLGWQMFRQIDTRPHRMRNGRDIRLRCFEAHCADCGVLYEAAATQTDWKRRWLTRRCEQCRPGGYVDNLAPPVPIASLPLWARPKRDAKSLRASLGMRQHHHCRLIGPKDRLRIIEPLAAARLRAAQRAKRVADHAAFVARVYARREVIKAARATDAPAVAASTPAGAPATAAPASAPLSFLD